MSDNEFDKNTDVPEGERLIQFSGVECTHCHDMNPIVEQLEKETGVKITKLEVWHNSKNAELFYKYDDNKCGGIPFFYNEKNGKWLCGNQTLEKLKEWAKE